MRLIQIGSFQGARTMQGVPEELDRPQCCHRIGQLAGTMLLVDDHEVETHMAKDLGIGW